MRILVNGKLVHESRNSWIINQSVRIDAPVPLRLVTAPRQGGTPVAVGRVDGGRLMFAVGTDEVEVVSRSNIFKTGESGRIWMYRD